MAALLQADDIAAIDAYIMSQPLNTPAAVAARDAWILWHDGTSILDRNFDRATLDRARNLRLGFELANATTDAERADILNRALTGLSLEQMQGAPDRRNSGGEYSERDGGLGVGTPLARLGVLVLGGLGVAVLAKRALMR